jgi:hypothetical protein
MGLSFTSSLERVIFDSGRAVSAMDLLKAAAMDVAKVIYGRNVADPLAGLAQKGAAQFLLRLRREQRLRHGLDDGGVGRHAALGGRRHHDPRRRNAAAALRRRRRGELAVGKSR